MRVYLDHHAATPVDPRVRAAMHAAADVAWANASSPHAEGRNSRARLERAREQVAAAIGAVPADVLLTAGGTEACNLGVLGALAHQTGGHAITSSIEHPALAAPLAKLAAAGALRVTALRVPAGRPPDVSELASCLDAQTRLVALQWVNHETGTVLPMPEYAELCRAAGVPLCVDATQAFGKLPIDVVELGADLIALASHKIGGPAGAGALWIRRGFSLDPLLLGGDQERGRRAGTPDVIAHVGFGAAAALVEERIAAQPRIARLRDRLEVALLGQGAVRNAPDGPRCATVSNLAFAGRRADTLVAALDLEGLSVSAGAACSSGKSEPSPVILAMHPEDPLRASASIRLSFGPEVNEIDVENAQAAWARVLARPSA